jgi:beta-galactosidase
MLLSRLCLLLALPAAAVQAAPPEWDNPAITAIGVEPPHATMMVYPDTLTARTFDPSRSPWRLSLDGDWKFRGVLRPADRPLDFHLPGYDDSGWRTMPVPGVWQMHGFDIPIYVNWIYPFPQDRNRMPSPPMISIPWAATGARSPFLRHGKDVLFISTLRAWTPVFMSG